MRKFNKIFFFIFLLSTKVYATHIVGGEIYYECLGNNTYKITLKVFRDCYNGVPWFDAPAYIGIFDNNSVLVDSLLLEPPGSDTLPITINNPCIIPPTNVCVEKVTYTGIKTLPPIPGGYTLTYQRCCRNHTILNLFNPSDVGSTYFTNIPDTSSVKCNNSPHFKNYPPVFICADLPLVFDHSAIDPDGDSLVYELCNTYHGASTFYPLPQPPVGPPYTVVPWLNGYSGLVPMDANPPISIDSKTGLITGTPTTIGQWVVGVCVREYRKGILLGIHKRDFQFNVTFCEQVVVSSIPAQQTFCFGKTVNFLNNSLYASTYHWDFGVPSLTNDTSNLKTPSYTYLDTGVYVVTLIGNPGTICADTATSTFKIYPALTPHYVVPPPQCILNNSYNFIGTGLTGNKSTFAWDFGANASPPNSSQKNPSGIKFSVSGKQLVKFTISDFGCSQSFIDTIVVLPPPTPWFQPQPGQCINDNHFDFTGTGNITTDASYYWTFGNNANPTNSTAQNVTDVTFNAVGKFPVTFSISDQGCTVSITDSITIYPLPKAKFSPIPRVGCKPLTVQFTDSSLSGTSINYSWNFGDGTTSSEKNPKHIFTKSGKYTVSLTIIASNGCVDTITFSIPNLITVLPGPTAAIESDKRKTTISNPDFNFSDLSLKSTSCKLLFGDADSSLDCNASHTYQKVGKYTVSQIVIDEYGCIDTSTILVEVTPDVRFWVPNAFSPNADGLNDFFMPITEGITEFHFMIFDRWGQLIFETNDQTKAWNGTYKKEECQQDVYVYVIKTTDINNSRKSYIGHVTLVR